MSVFKHLDIAPCGLNCGRCKARFRKKNPCPGCRAMTGAVRSSWFNVCLMRNCTERKKPHCGGCDVFPCVKLRNLDKRYRLKYGTAPIANLEFIHASGIRRFLAKEEAERCRGGCIHCMHDGKLYPSPSRD
jgi:hypothetical protein